MTINTANFANEIHFANSDAVPSPQICPQASEAEPEIETGNLGKRVYVTNNFC